MNVNKMLFVLLSLALMSHATMPDAKSLALALDDFLSTANQANSPFEAYAGKRLTLGTPMPIWRITNESAQQYIISHKEKDLYVRPSTVFVPVIDGEKSVLLLKLVSANGKDWQTAGIGFSDLAREMAVLNEVWPLEQHDWMLVENEISREFMFSILDKQEANLNRFQFFGGDALEEGSTQPSKYVELGKTEQVITQILKAVGVRHEK